MNYSWYYFDLVGDDGLKLVVVFYRYPFFLSFDIALIDVSVYQNDSKQHFGFPVPIIESKYQEEPLRLDTPDGSLSFDNGDYKLAIDNRFMTLQLKLSSCFTQWQPQMIPLFRNRNQFFNWKVLIPQGNVEGIFEMEGTDLALSGKGYLDYNEGNIPLNRHISQWYWGRLHSAESSLIFSSLNFEQGSSYHPLLWIDHKGSCFQELENGIFGDANTWDLSQVGIKRRLKMTGQITFDRVNFLISPIPVLFKFPRKVHEFIFYRLEERKWGRKFNRMLANVKYERRLISAADNGGNPYQGLMEHIIFK